MECCAPVLRWLQYAGQMATVASNSMKINCLAKPRYGHSLHCCIQGSCWQCEQESPRAQKLASPGACGAALPASRAPVLLVRAACCSCVCEGLSSL